MQEIKRLVSTTSDPERKASLEEQLRELELASVQAEQLVDATASPPSKDATTQRRKSFRPTSAKPRMLLSALSEVLYVQCCRDTTTWLAVDHGYSLTHTSRASYNGTTRTTKST